MTNSKTNIAIVDDDLLFVQLLTSFLKQDDSLEIVLAVTSGNEFIAQYEKHAIDIAIVDLRMTDGNGLAVLEQLNQTESKIKRIVLSTFYRRSFMGQMLKSGANAFLPKEIDQQEFLNVIDAVKKYGHFFSEEQLAVMRKQLSNKLPQFHLPQKDGLTEREIAILQLLCQQFKTKEIADKLFISPKTVETHKSNLMLKAGVKNTAGLVIYAVQNKIVDPDEVVLIDW